MLSDKTAAIKTENYLSVVYAREMAEGLNNMNVELTNGFIKTRRIDSLKIYEMLNKIKSSLIAERNNITEPGEDELVSDIESDFENYKDSVIRIINTSNSISGMLYLQEKSADLFQKVMALSKMNGTAIEMKTGEARIYAKKALTNMTSLASICFIIGMSFTFSFASYFNERFFQLYNGIREIAKNNYDQHLFFYGNDEFNEISLVLNEMADKLKENKQKMSVTLQDDKFSDIKPDYAGELSRMLLKIKVTEEEAKALISKIEKNKT
jgi:methyl-accepting chemotaxis protein